MNWHISCVNSYMKLYIISNRLPVKVTKEDETFVFSRSEGGLATGLDSLQISYEKHWIGWPGICVDNYNPQIQISAESETKRSIFREKDKTKRSKKESAQHSKSRNKSFVMTSVSAL